jgi:ubiquinone biosynthesis protein
MVRLKSRIRHYGRYSEIVRVLFRHGFGDFIDRIKVSRLLRFGGHASERFAGMSYAVRIRLAMEELGPSFIKLGQILSNRPFLIPPELVFELAKLQDDVSPIDFSGLRETMENEFGKPLNELFSDVDEQSIASASLAQVHLATTVYGDRVAVKVLKPGVRKMLEIDMEILRDVAGLMEKYIPESNQYKPVEQVDQLARASRREVDLYVEARNIEVFRSNFADDPDVYIPKVYWDLSGPSVLTTSIVDGIKVSDVDRLDAAGLDRSLLARRGARLVFKMMFEDRFFHADPHPGNLFVMSSNRWAPVDFGLVGTISETSIDLLAKLLLAASRMDARGAVKVLEAHNLLEDSVDGIALESEINDLLHRYYKTSLKQINMKRGFYDVMDIFTRYRIRVPSSLMLLGKAVGTYEEVARMLDPDVNLAREAEPFIKKLAYRKLDAKRISSSALSLVDSVYDLVNEAPSDLRRLSYRLLKGDMKFILSHIGLDKLSTDLDRASNRISFSLIIAAIIIGSSWIMTSEHGYTVYGIPLLGVLGYSVAAALGLWLVISIIRSGRL